MSRKSRVATEVVADVVEALVSTEAAAPVQVQAEQVETSAVAAKKPKWPARFKVTNNTPIPLYLSEAGVNLPPNFMAPKNTALATYTSEDALTREKANADAIGRAHNFKDVLLVEAAG